MGTPGEKEHFVIIGPADLNQNIIFQPGGHFQLRQIPQHPEDQSRNRRKDRLDFKRPTESFRRATGIEKKVDIQSLN